MNILKAVDLQFNALSHRLRRVPVIVLMPHSRCNCRCIMCDIWKSNRAGTSITEEQLENFLDGFRRLKVEWVLLSGGEPLMRRDLYQLVAMIARKPAIRDLAMTTNGVLLAEQLDRLAFP